MDFILKYSEQLTSEIEKVDFPHFPENLYHPLQYFLSLGGKRMRPVATILAGELFGVEFEKTKNTALAVELFHNFSLIHDDIMDNAPLRRGMQTVHEKWNPNIAILSGDVLFVKAYELLSKNDSNHLPSLLEVFNKTAIEVCEGQQLDMDFEQKSHVSKEEYIEMIRLKTSVLLGAALKMGAILGDASEENQQLIYEFGENLGIAFQIQDDLLDLYGQPDKVGKQVGGDILANKKTLLTILAKQDASEDETNKMNQIFKLSSDVEKVSQTISLFEQLEIESKCKEEIKYYFENSLSSLEKIKDCDSKENLKQLALFLFNREF